MRTIAAPTVLAAFQTLASENPRGRITAHAINFGFARIPYPNDAGSLRVPLRGFADLYIERVPGAKTYRLQSTYRNTVA